MPKPKLSIVCRFRNEYPIVLSTLYSLFEDATFSGLPFELIMVDNLSDDVASDVLEDRFRRWTRQKLLKVVRYSEKPSTWCAINAGWKEATGDVLVVADAHISVRRGTLGLLAHGATDQGGIWHPSVQLWGDEHDVPGSYGYDLRLVERFWGNPCRHLPPGRKKGEAWRVPMAGACLLAVHRREIERHGLYHSAFRAYGGGEPYLDLKWWLGGSAVWCHSGALCRHAFGLRHEWREVTKERTYRNEVYCKDGTMTRTPAVGTKILSHSAGYEAPSTVDFAFNFALAAYALGGEAWLDNTLARLVRGDRAEDRASIRSEVLAEAGEPIGGLDDLLAAHPWERCREHEQEAPLGAEQPALEEAEA